MLEATEKIINYLKKKEKMPSFFAQLESRCKSVDSILCVGLDPHEDDLKRNNISAEDFCKKIIDATRHVAAAYKPNAAFFEALGEVGVRQLVRVIEYIGNEIPVVLDVKRGDISSTAQAYSTAAFDIYKANCVTLSPYMGQDSIDPFTGTKEERGAFILCKTSNPSSNDFETLQLANGQLLYEKVAHMCEEKYNKLDNIGLVVGATDVEALRRSRQAAPSLWILAPGVGFQGGNLEQSASAGLRADGLGLLVPISRGISRAESPKSAAEDFRRQLNEARHSQNKKRKSSALEQYKLDFFKLAIKCDVLRFGDFTLKSGRKSPYFFNAGLFSTGSAIAELGKFYAQSIVNRKVKFDVIFGPAYKGIPLAAAIACSLYTHFGLDVPYAYNRKEAKDHGEGGVLVGASMKSKRVLVVDDVITAGTAIRESISLLKKENANVVAVAVALDRQERAKNSDQSSIGALATEFDIDVFSVATLDDLLEYIAQNPTGENAESTLAAVQSYRKEFGV